MTKLFRVCTVAIGDEMKKKRKRMSTEFEEKKGKIRLL